MKGKFILFLLLISVFPLTLSFADFIVSTPHTGKINKIIYPSTGNIIFSAADDGTVRIWDSVTKKVVRVIRISQSPVLDITLSSAKNEFAVIVKDPAKGYELEAWDWMQGRMLFSYPLSENLLDFSYSPDGTFIAFSQPKWDSLTFLDSTSGRRLPYLRHGFGIVSKFYISLSGQTLMTYNASGSIQYWNLKEGTNKKVFSTLGDLGSLSFRDDIRYMAGFNGGNLYLIDLVNGAVAAKTETAPILKTYFLSANTIAALIQDNNGLKLSLFSFSGSSLYLSKNVPFKQSISALTFNRNFFLSYGNSGSICSINPYTEIQTDFVQTALVRIKDIDFIGNSAFLSSPDKLFMISSDFFLTNLIQSSSFQIKFIDSPFRDNSGLAALKDGRLLIWGGGSDSFYSFFDPENGSFSENYETEYPIITIRVSDSQMAIVEDGGRCVVKDLTTLSDIFTFNAFGIHDVAFAEDNKLLVGKTKSSDIDSALMEVNIVTGETVPIDDNSIHTYSVLYEPASKRLYTLGVARDPKISSMFKYYIGTHFEYQKLLLSTPAEDYYAGLVMDPDTGAVFTSLGFNQVRQYRWNSLRYFPGDTSIPRNLCFYSKLLYSINRDNSLTVWNPKNGTPLMRFYLWENGEYAALLSDGTYRCSPNGEKFISEGF